MEFEEVAAHFGYSLGRRRDSGEEVRATPTASATAAKCARRSCCRTSAAASRSRNYQKLVAKIEGKPEERILSYLMLRSLKQARYSTENVGHFALAAASYTHFTSPIRRYPDLIVHRLLTATLDAAPLRTGPARASPTSARNPSAAPPMPSANWWSGRR